MALGSDIRPLKDAALLEMGLWVKDGATPWQTLLAATSNAAALCGVGDDLGTVEVGKLADLIVVEANPLEDINSVRRLVLVLKDGRLVSDRRKTDGRRFRPTSRSASNERCRKPGPHAAALRRRHLLRQPRHQRDAFRRRARPDRAGMHCVLGLQENVVTGMADGYYRIAGKPACTLLHCGPGLANGLANLHNARRARSGIVNIVGDQATYHRPHDAPLTADTDGLARTVSAWVRTSTPRGRRGPRRGRRRAGRAHRCRARSRR